MGRGWAFSVIDFATFGNRPAIDVTLHRLQKKGTIRRVTRGIYDYPRQSKRLGGELSPDISQVAQALARKYGWRIQPSGDAALNLLGLSTQVPSQFLYLSDGPNRTHQIGRQTLVFKKAPLKESSVKLRESGIIVQALRSLGRERISSTVVSKIHKWLDPEKRSLVLKDCRTVTGWVYDAIRRICDQESTWNE